MNVRDQSEVSCCVVPGASMLGDDEAERMAVVLKAVADPVRLRLLSIIASAPAGEVCACDLPMSVGRSQPTVSHHLSQLVTAGLLDREQRGRWAWFRVRSSAVDALCAAIRTCCHPIGAEPEDASRVVDSITTE